MKYLVFNPIKGINVKYLGDKKVFNPTRTSKILIKAIYKNKKKFNKYKKILDLGCGTAVLGIALKKILKTPQIYFSDVSSNAINLSKKNLRINNVKYEIKKSNLLKQWGEIKFDLIVNDVSAISSFFKKKNFWYNNKIPCDSGLDGTKNTIKFLESVSKNCKNIIMPLISLSNTKFIKQYLIKKKIKYKILTKESWPLPEILVKKNSKKLIKMKKDNLIDFKIKFGMYIAFTEVIEIKL